MTIFIPHNVPSSKNSRLWTGKMSIASPAVQKWRKNTDFHWRHYKDQFIEKTKGYGLPLRIGLHFVRGTRHRYDWVNPVQTIQDAMVKHGWIPDDDVTNLMPFPSKYGGEYTSYDKERPGVIIRILKS